MLILHNIRIILIFEYFQEYEHKSSPEAAFVKDLDKFDFILQAFEYEKREKKTYEDIQINMEGKVTHPLLVNILNEMKSQRQTFLKELNNEN